MDSLLGEGGMGAVYDALDLRIERRVAVKLLHSHLLHRTELVERFLREARAVGRIGHATVTGLTSPRPVRRCRCWFNMTYTIICLRKTECAKHICVYTSIIGIWENQMPIRDSSILVRINLIWRCSPLRSIG